MIFMFKNVFSSRFILWFLLLFNTLYSLFSHYYCYPLDVAWINMGDHPMNRNIIAYRDIYYLVNDLLNMFFSSALLEEFGLVTYLLSLILCVFSLIKKSSKAFVLMTLFPFFITLFLYVPLYFGVSFT